MTPVVIPTAPALLPMSRDNLDKVRRLESALLEMPQLPVETAHLIHAGTYARTIRIPAGVALVGAEIKIDTVLIFNGDATVLNDGERLELRGYHVIPASKGRKQVFMAHADTDLTMIFSTSASSVPDAECEFTDEAHLLGSRRDGALNVIDITGSK
jgi:hypothetical protein